MKSCRTKKKKLAILPKKKEQVKEDNHTSILPPTKSKTQVTEDHSSTDEKGTCIWNLGSLIKATASKGQLIPCRNGDRCPLKHVSLRDITKKVAKDLVRKMPNDKLRGTYERALEHMTGFKENSDISK